jgi:hypothetical protein
MLVHHGFFRAERLLDASVTRQPKTPKLSRWSKPSVGTSETTEKVGTALVQLGIATIARLPAPMPSFQSQKAFDLLGEG